MIKNNQVEKILKMNPFYTKKDIPKISDIKMASNMSTKLLKELNMFDSSAIDKIVKLENHPKIGVDGTILILSTMLKLTNINKNKSWKENIDFIDSWFRDDFFEDIQIIFDYFDITPKVFIDKSIREMFYNNICLKDFVIIIKDYINMCKLLNIPLGNKLPKDIIRRHNILQVRIIEFKAVQLKDDFIKKSLENEELLTNIPNSKYTILVPKTPNDLIEEGFQLNHCVSSYAYPFIDGTSKIFFIRDKNNINKSLATVELNKFNQLVQVKAYSNKKPSNDILEFLDNWLNTLNSSKKVCIPPLQQLLWQL